MTFPLLGRWEGKEQRVQNPGETLPCRSEDALQAQGDHTVPVLNVRALIDFLDFIS